MLFFKEKTFFIFSKKYNILPVYSQHYCMAQPVQNIKCLLNTFQKLFFVTTWKISMAKIKSYRDLMSLTEIKMSYSTFTLLAGNNCESFLRTRFSSNRQGQAVPFV